MSQQQTDRELVLERLCSRFKRNDFSANDPVLAGLDPHDAIQLLAEAMILEQSRFRARETSMKWKITEKILPIICGMVLYLISISLISRKMIVLVMMIGQFVGNIIVIFIGPKDKAIQSAKQAIPDLARRVHHQKALPSLLDLVDFLPPTLNQNAHDAVEEAICRVLMETKGVSSVPLSESQKVYLRRLLERHRTNERLVVALLLLLGSERDTKIRLIAANLARFSSNEHIRTVAAEVYWDLKDEPA